MRETVADEDVAAAREAGEGLGPRPQVDALDLADLQARDRLRAWVVGGEATSMQVGRFTVLRRLGAGGMGTVYAAYDEELDRRVALKFLNPGKAKRPEAQHRLLREAQALARLSHPNLVPVYEVGRHEGQVYLAMELVEGVTMRKWARDEVRTWQQTLRAWLEVARVLTVVHAEGLVHRDVKPDNVIMGADGHPRLVDFGLAREVGEPGSGTSGSHRSGGAGASSTWSGGSRLGESVTRTHAVVGTPAYLAPEQRLGEICGPAADQYSFCVALYEGLYDCRPPGAVDEPGALVDVPQARSVPEALRRALSRGLQFEADRRFESMTALADALERPLGRRRRLWTGVAATTAVAGVVGLLAVASRPSAAPPPGPCEGVGSELLHEWSASPASKHTDGVAVALGAWVDEWVATREQACVQTRVRGEHSLVVLDRRMACLDRLGARVLAVAGSRVDETTRRQVAAELGAPADCMVAAIAEGQAMQPAVATAEQRRQLDEMLATVPMLAYRGDVARARGQAQAAVRFAEQLDDELAVAAALAELGTLESSDFRPEPARDALERAVDLAEANGDALLKEDALARLVRLAVDVELDPAVALRSWERNAAALRRLPGSADRSARLLSNFGLVQRLRGDRIGAEASMRAALAEYAKVGPRGGPARASTLRHLAGLLRAQGRTDEAMAAVADAATLERGIVGSGGVDWDNTNSAERALVEGTAAVSAGDLGRARRALGEASERYDRICGRRCPDYGYAQVALAQVAVNEGRLDDARRHAEAGDLALRSGLGPDHPDRLPPLSALGTVAFEQGRIDASVVSFRRALEIAQQHEGHDPTIVAGHRSNLAEALLAAGEPDEAQGLAAAALEQLEALLPPEHVHLAFPLRALGEAAVRSQRPAQAIAPLSRAVALHDAAGAYPVELARSRAWLARALAATAQPEQARASAAAAIAGFERLGDAYAHEVRALKPLLAPEVP